MRKLIEATLVTLDGVFEAPNVWATEYFDEEAEASALARLMAADGMLMGRGVYEFFLAAFPHQTGDYAARINTMRKYVVSNTLEEARWNNTTVIRGDLVDQVSKLKEEGENDLVMYGHGRLGAALLRLGLLDELNLFIHPLFRGHGKLLFREGEEARLKLVWTRALKAGVTAATYQPVRS